MDGVPIPLTMIPAEFAQRPRAGERQGVEPLAACARLAMTPAARGGACLRFGSHTVLFSRIMPLFVADGDEAVAALTRGHAAVVSGDTPERMHALERAVFHLRRTGDPATQDFLADLARQRFTADDFCDRQWSRHS